MFTSTSKSLAAFEMTSTGPMGRFGKSVKRSLSPRTAPPPKAKDADAQSCVMAVKMTVT
jgi:hypothetical protein